MPNSKHDIKKLLRSSGLVNGGFMGTDTRDITEIIRADRMELGRLRRTAPELADTLDHLTRRAGAAQGATMSVTPAISIRANDIRGALPCPLCDAGHYAKSMTEAVFSDGRPPLRWSGLSIHLIRAHGFFQGKGSPFRLEPAALAILRDETA